MDGPHCSPITKVCNACGREFPREWFYPRGDGRSGVLSECRRCCTVRRRESRLRQRERIVDGVVRQAARSRPDRLRTAVNIAIARLGGPDRFGEHLAEGFLAAMENGSANVKFKFCQTLFAMIRECELVGDTTQGNSSTAGL